MVKHVAAIFANHCLELLYLMIELTRTNDSVLLSWLTCHLEAAGVEFVVFDTHTSILEGSIGAIPRRVMVLAEQGADARRVLEQAYSHDAKDATIDAKEKSDMVYWLPGPVKS
jgi:hypothetical protein